MQTAGQGSLFSVMEEASPTGTGSPQATHGLQTPQPFSLTIQFICLHDSSKQTSKKNCKNLKTTRHITLQDSLGAEEMDV